MTTMMVLILFVRFRCHNSFFENNHNAFQVNFALEDVEELFELLNNFSLTDERKTYLETKDFN